MRAKQGATKPGTNQNHTQISKIRIITKNKGQLKESWSYFAVHFILEAGSAMSVEEIWAGTLGGAIDTQGEVDQLLAKLKRNGCPQNFTVHNTAKLMLPNSDRWFPAAPNCQLVKRLRNSVLWKASGFRLQSTSLVRSQSFGSHLFHAFFKNSLLLESNWESNWTKTEMKVILKCYGLLPGTVWLTLYYTGNHILISTINPPEFYVRIAYMGVTIL